MPLLLFWDNSAMLTSFNLKLNDDLMLVCKIMRIGPKAVIRNLISEFWKFEKNCNNFLFFSSFPDSYCKRTFQPNFAIHPSPVVWLRTKSANFGILERKFWSTGLN